MELVYRIEDKYNSGPYRGKSIGKLDRIHPEWLYNFMCRNRHPTPKADGIVDIIESCGAKKNPWLKCGFASIKQLLDWFNDDAYLQSLSMAGFKVSVFESRQVYHGGRQVVFNTRRSKRVVQLDPLQLVEKRAELKCESSGTMRYTFEFQTAESGGTK